MNDEPVLIVGAFQTAVVALVSLGVFSLTDIQQAAVLAAFTAILSVIVRHKVTPAP